MQTAIRDLQLKHLWVVYPGNDEYQLDETISILPIRMLPLQVQSLRYGEKEMNPKDALQELIDGKHPDLTENLVNALNERGIISDGDKDVGASSVMVEWWYGTCTEHLRKNGYNGGELARAGDHFPNHGAIYILYDKERFTSDDAIENLNMLGRRKPI